MITKPCYFELDETMPKGFRIQNKPLMKNQIAEEEPSLTEKLLGAKTLAEEKQKTLKVGLFIPLSFIMFWF